MGGGRRAFVREVWRLLRAGRSVVALDAEDQRQRAVARAARRAATEDQQDLLTRDVEEMARRMEQVIPGYRALIAYPGGRPVWLNPPGAAGGSTIQRLTRWGGRRRPSP